MLVSLCTLFSCKQKQENNDIIVEKVVDKPQSGAIATPEKKSSGTVKWVNSADYGYSISISSDSDLPEVMIGEEKYKDNSVHLVVTRSDGSDFYSGTFTKNSFTGLLPNQVKQHGILIGFSFDHADESKLYFVASIGSPDESSEVFTLVQLILDKMGTTTVATYTPEEIPQE